MRARKRKKKGNKILLALGIIVVIAAIVVGFNLKHQHDVKVHAEQVAAAYQKQKDEANEAEQTAATSLSDSDISKAEQLASKLKKDDASALTKKIDQVKTAKTQVESARAAVDTLSKDLSDTTIAQAQEKINQITEAAVSADKTKLQAQLDADKKKLEEQKAKAAAEAKAAEEALMKQTGVNVPAGSKVVALTFDDGPNPTTTPKLLQILKENNVHATFFALGEEAQANPSIIKQEAADGNEVASHTWDHKDLTTLSAAAATQEIMSAHNLINSLTGQQVNLFRPPYGSYNKSVLGLTDLSAVNWTVDTNDWRYKTSDPVVKNAVSAAHNGAIILLHDIHPWSVNVVPAIIQQLKAQGYTFVTVSQLLQIQDGGAQPHQVYFGK